MSTQFKNTADAAAHLAENPEVAQAVNREIQRNALVSLLLTMRVEKGITQEKVAESMGCDASKISRIESGNDTQLKWLDIVGYVKALHLQMSVLFDDESLPAAARIKQCVFKIDDDLRKLAQIAQQFGDDDRICEKINEFYREVLFNFLKRFNDNQEKLPNFINIPPKREISPLQECKPPKIPESVPLELTHK
jgi:transcriptional regulator with XRE-family HTH domain